MIANPIPWPNGARCACALTFDMDADSLIHISRPVDGFDRLNPISMGRYGPNVAVPRILGTYKPFSMTATRLVITAICTRIRHRIPMLNRAIGLTAPWRCISA
jgi:hypothetical protein